MVDSWLPGFKMDSQIKNEHKKNIEGKISIIKRDIISNVHFKMKNSVIDKLLTNMQIKNKSKPHKGLTGNTIGLGIKPYLTVEEGCIKCSTCVKVCPVNNIELINNEVTLKDHCLSCFACTHNCPVNVMRLKNERDTSRFRNSHITVNDIIKSNE